MFVLGFTVLRNSIELVMLNSKKFNSTPSDTKLLAYQLFQCSHHCVRRYCPLVSNLGIIFRDSIRTRMKPSLESVPHTAADASVTNLTQHLIECVWQGN